MTFINSIKRFQVWTIATVIWHLCICSDPKSFNNGFNSVVSNITLYSKLVQLDGKLSFDHYDLDNYNTEVLRYLVDDQKKMKRSISNHTTNVYESSTISVNELQTYNDDNKMDETENSPLYLHADNNTRSHKNLSNESMEDLISNEREENEFEMKKEDSQTTDYFLDNYTEPCVGYVEYCNMTKEDYISMLQEYIYPQPFEWVLICIHAIVFSIGLIGNSLVCIAVYRNHSMRTVTNYFIVNLAVADFMVILICLPPTVLWDVTETWFFGTAMCRVVLYFQSVSVTVSVLTLTFISVDRWYAICFPLKFKSTTGRAKTAILIIWLLSLLFNLPEFVVLQVQRKMELRFNMQYFMQCTSTWSQDSDLKWHVVKALFLYTFPLLLMTIAYYQIVRVLWRSNNIPGHTESHKLNSASGQNSWSTTNRRPAPSINTNTSTEGQLRSRRKAAKMLVAVVAMFAVCYFPVHLLSVIRFATDVQQTNVMSCIALFSHVMCYANSAVNPLIYNFMSGKFRREFHRAYFKCFCCCQTTPSPDRNGTSFAPLGSSRTATTRTMVRRNDSCVSYRLTHLSPSNHNNVNRDCIRNTTSNTSFIENVNANRNPIRIRDNSISESATRFNVNTDVGRD